MKRQLLVGACLSAGFAATGCGGGGSKVSSASLRGRLLPVASAPGFGLQRTLDWSDPVNLVGEGLSLPQITHPSEAIKEFKDAHLRGGAGEVLANGSGFNATEVVVGVARFNGAADANRVRDWMHRQDLHQPCFSQCIFAPGALPPGAPRGARVGPAPANYLAEFTIGPYLYWAVLHGDASAKARFEQGVKLYYAHAKQASLTRA